MFLSKSVYSAVQPIWIILLVFGANPYSNAKSKSVFPFMYFFSYFIFSSIATVLALLWLQEKDPGWYTSLIYLTIEKLQTGVLYFNYLIVVFTALKEHKNIRLILLELTKIDKALRTVGANVKYEYGTIIMITVIRYVGVLVLIGLDVLASWGSVLVYNLADITSTFGLLLPIYAQQIINYALLKFVKDHFNLMSSKMEESQVFTSVDRMHSFLRIYDSLSAVSLQLNDVFSRTVLWSLNTVLCSVIVTLHLMVTSFWYDHGSGFGNVMPLGCLTLCSRAFELWNLIQPYVDLTNEVGLDVIKKLIETGQCSASLIKPGRALECWFYWVKI